MIRALICLLILAAPGCPQHELNGDTLTVQLRDDPARPKPACIYTIRIDGRLLHWGRLAECIR